MNLLYILTAYPPSTGGAQFLQHKLAQEFNRQHRVRVVSMWDTHRTDWLLGTTLRAPANDTFYTIDGVSVHRIGLSPWEKGSLAPSVLLYYPLMDVALPPIAACLERHLYADVADTDLIHHTRIGREALGYAAFQVARRRAIPFVLTPLHHPRWVGYRYRAYLKLYTLADAVVALTEAEKRTLIALGVQEQRIVVTGMGPSLAPHADASRFRRRYGIDGPFILFLGQHYPYKGYQQLLEATALIWQKVPEAHVVFIGPAVKQSERVFEHYQDTRIHRLGSVDLQTKTDALAACAILCVPSTQESFGGVYTEAWSFGKPVIGCAIPATTEVIADGVDGLLVAQNAGAIADSVCTLLREPQLAQAMGAAGQQKVQERYTWQQIAQRTEAAYRMALGSTGHSQHKDMP